MKTVASTTILSSARAFLALCFAANCVSIAFAQWPNLPATPLSVQAVGDPNVLLTLDDSGSMASAYAPDSINNISTEARWMSARVNSMAYNPFELYVAPYSSTLTGAKLTASFTSAYMSGFDTSLGGAPVNLSTSYRPVFSFNPSDTTFNNVAELFQSSYIGGYAPQAAFIYSFYTDLSPTNTLPTPGVDTPTSFVRRTTLPSSCPGPTAITNNSCYIKVTIPTAHRSNFAIWYSFYKTRNLVVASSTNIAFYELSPRYRVSWQTLTKCVNFNSADCQGYDNLTRANKLRRLDDVAHKTSFYQYLARLPANGNTPLRRATELAGEFIKRTGIESPRANQLGISETGPDSVPINACRANYHVLLTDGVWNGTPNTISVGNADGTGRTLGDLTTAYVPRAPYTDSNTNSVADLAFAQWANDADTSVGNSVTRHYADPDTNTDYWDPKNDPATWQHMNTFAIGLGLGGFLAGQTTAAGVLPVWGGSTYAGAYPALKAGTQSWPTTGDGSEGNVADLWHAALNGRGEFFSADSPRAITEAFRGILARVASSTTSSGQVATSSRRVGAGSLSFSVGYKTGSWHSTITANNVNTDGTEGTVAWTTDSTLSSDSPARNLVTWQPSTGLARSFTWTAFSAAEQLSLFNNDQDMLNYLRGNRSNETTATTIKKFRQRKQLLGDVVGSEMIASAKTDQGFGFLPPLAGGSGYRSFVNAKKSVVFAGANDGMLHAFSATGTELFGYIPSSALPKIKSLSLSPLGWQPLVDGPLTLGDIYVGGAWKTVVVGGLGGGGSAVFGLDVTGVTQTSGSGTFTTSNVLFDVSDVEMGYSFSKPVIGRTAAGQWVAIWGNGYGGASRRAYLFVYNFTTSTLSKIDTGVGTAAEPNGLGSPAGVEFTAGNIVAVYAGDYRGNLWKFNLNASGAFDRANATTPFFQAKDGGGKIQPLTAAPEVALHPAGGVVVLFGTGKFFESQDRGTRDVHTFYSVRDTGQTTTALRTELVAQTITAGTDLTSVNRAVSVNAVDYTTKRGWFLDFNTTISGGPSGERIIARPILLGDTAVFATYAPGLDACQGDGLGFLMVANIFVGGLVSPFLDVTGDGIVDARDQAATGNNISGIKISTPGTLTSPVATLVSVQPRGSRGTRPPSATCGALNQVPCAATEPRPGCEAGLTVKAGRCQPLACDRGGVILQAGATAQCGFSGEVKFPRWMELKWK